MGSVCNSSNTVMPFEDKKPKPDPVMDMIAGLNKQIDESRAETDRLAKELQERDEASRKAEEAARKAEDEGKQGSAVLDEMTQEERRSARGRQRQKAVAAFGRRDTILTGPLGEVGQMSGMSKKTLLGE